MKKLVFLTVGSPGNPSRANKGLSLGTIVSYKESLNGL